MNPSVDQANQGAGLPKMSDIYSNIQAPSLGDIGGSLGNKAASVNQGPSDAFSQYSNFAKSLANPVDTSQQLLAQNGIPQLQKTSENLQGNINNLEDQINRVTPNVSANTSNSLVTEGQREGMVNAQEFPLQQSLSPLVYGLGQVNSSLSTQEQNIANEVNAQGQYQGQQLQAQGMGVTVAQDNAARQMTGYTQDADNMLQGLLKKMDIQGQLDAAEWTTLSELASKKQEYQNNIQKQQVANQYQVVPAGHTLVNTFTGKTYSP